MRRSIWLAVLAAASCAAPVAAQAEAEAGSGDPEIPLPEHPRPDFTRDDWVNLNGTWQFQFDAADEGRQRSRDPLDLAVVLAQKGALDASGAPLLELLDDTRELALELRPAPVGERRAHASE